MSDIFLIDDEEVCNFSHELIIKKTGLFNEINIYTAAAIALTQLKTRERTGMPGPALILLDLNMPGMDGFQFLDELSKMPADFLNGIKVVMLTSSINEKENGRAFAYGVVADFCYKPLSEQTLKQVLARLYPNWVAI